MKLELHELPHVALLETWAHSLRVWELSSSQDIICCTSSDFLICMIVTFSVDPLIILKGISFGFKRSFIQFIHSPYVAIDLKNSKAPWRLFSII